MYKSDRRPIHRQVQRSIDRKSFLKSYLCRKQKAFSQSATASESWAYFSPDGLCQAFLAFAASCNGYAAHCGGAEQSAVQLRLDSGDLEVSPVIKWSELLRRRHRMMFALQQQATTCFAANAGCGGLDLQQTIQGIVLHMLRSITHRGSTTFLAL